MTAPVYHLEVLYFDHPVIILLNPHGHYFDDTSDVFTISL